MQEVQQDTKIHYNLVINEFMQSQDVLYYYEWAPLSKAYDKCKELALSKYTANLKEIEEATGCDVWWWRMYPNMQITPIFEGLAKFIEWHNNKF